MLVSFDDSYLSGGVMVSEERYARKEASTRDCELQGGIRMRYGIR